MRISQRDLAELQRRLGMPLEAKPVRKSQKLPKEYVSLVGIKIGRNVILREEDGKEHLNSAEELNTWLG